MKTIALVTFVSSIIFGISESQASVLNCNAMSIFNPEDRTATVDPVKTTLVVHNADGSSTDLVSSSDLLSYWMDRIPLSRCSKSQKSVEDQKPDYLGYFNDASCPSDASRAVFVYEKFEGEDGVGYFEFYWRSEKIRGIELTGCR